MICVHSILLFRRQKEINLICTVDQMRGQWVGVQKSLTFLGQHIFMNFEFIPPKSERDNISQQVFGGIRCLVAHKFRYFLYQIKGFLLTEHPLYLRERCMRDKKLFDDH